MIRLATTNDARQIVEIYRPFCADTTITFETEVPSEKEMQNRIGSILESYPFIVDEEQDLVTGYAYACRHRSRAAYRWSVETSIYVRQQNRRTGLGSRLYECLLDVLKAQGYFNAYAGIAKPNPVSESFHKAQGYEHIGTYKKIGFKLGKWHDVGWWHRQLQEEVANGSPPAEPIDPLEAFRIATDGQLE